jgi:hypothetical protein
MGIVDSIVVTTNMLDNHLGVDPFGETDCVLTGCRWLKIAVYFAGSPAGSAAVGQAETGSGGDQPVKE